MMRMFGVLLALGIFASAVSAVDKEQNPFEKVQEKAAKSGLSILLVFSANWSEQSKTLSKDVLNSPDFKRFVRDHFIIFKVDFSRGQKDEDIRKLNNELSNKYKIHGIPSLVVADSSGKMVASAPGTLNGDANAYIAWLEKVLDKLKK